MTSCQRGLCCFWLFCVYLNGECVYLRLCGIHMCKILYLLLLWLLIRPDLCSVGAQYRHSQRSSWSNEQTCLKRSRSVDIRSNTFSMVSSQSDHFFLWDKMEYLFGSSADSHRQRSFLAPRQWDRKCLVSLGWPLYKSAVCRGFRVDLQVPSEKTQPVVDMGRGDAIRHTAPSEKIKWDQRNRGHFRLAASLQGRNTKCSFTASLAWNCLWLLLRTHWKSEFNLVTWCSTLYL